MPAVPRLVLLTRVLSFVIGIISSPSLYAFDESQIEDVTFKATGDGSEQRYVLVTPPGLQRDQPVTVLIALHGHGSDRWQFVKQTRDECRAVRDVAIEQKLLLVSPDYRATTSWMGPRAEADLRQIIGLLKKQWLVSRVILSGGSMGGTGALTFTALHPELIDGVVSLNGTADLVSYDRFQDAIAESFGGSKTQVPDEYRRRSALFFPERFTMPVAATTGGMDTIVPPDSVLKLLEAVRSHNPLVLSRHRPEGGHSTNYDDSRQALEFVLQHAPHRLKSLPKYPRHDDVRTFMNEAGQLEPIRTLADWQVRRRHILEAMTQVMGELPAHPSAVPLDVQVMAESRDGGLIRRRLSYQSDRHDRVFAWLLLPETSSNQAQRRPAMLCLHQTTSAGKDEPVGHAGSPNMHYALELARRGYVTLSPDYPSLGEHPYDFAQHPEFASGTIKAVHDNRRAVDLLQSLPQVDADRIGVIGHSLGGHSAMFTAAFDERLKIIVSSCGFAGFQKDDIPSWTGPRYMPRIATVFHNDANQLPFDFPEVIASFAPRPFFVSAALHDSDFDAASVRQCLEAARLIYQLLEHPDHVQAVYPDTPHDFPSAAREEAYRFLDRHLRP